MKWPHRLVLDWVSDRLDEVWDRAIRKVMGLGPDDHFDIFGPGEDGDEDVSTQQAA